MTMFEPNNSGTIAFTAGSTAIAGVGTLLRNYRAGSVLSIPGLGEMQLATDPTDDLAATGVVAWQGADTGPQAFQYIPRNEQAVLSQKLTVLLNQLSNGNLQAFAEMAGADGLLPFFTGAGTMATIPLASLSAGAVARVETPAELAQFDDELTDFAVFIGDADGQGRGALRWKLSDDSGDWSDPAWYTGRTGDVGASGEPLLAIIQDAAGVVPGTYPISRRIHAAGTCNHLYAELLIGSGEAMLYLHVNGAPAAGPIALTAGVPINDAGFALTLAEGDAVDLVVAGVAGAVSYILVQIEGAQP